jgi:hypothetical protein
MLLNAQHSEEEVKEIFGVFHLTELISDSGLAFLTAQVTENSFSTLMIPTKGNMERNTSGEVYSAQIISLLEKVYNYEMMYRTGTSIWLQLYREEDIMDSRLIPEDKRLELEEEWRKRMEYHPGHLIELALGENVLDSLQMKSKRAGTSYGGNGRMDWENYQTLVPITTSIYEATTPAILDLLSSLELTTEEIYGYWKDDMEANGYFVPAVLLKNLADEMGEFETKDARLAENKKLLDQLEANGLMTAENRQAILTNDSLVASSEYSVFLPYLINTSRFDFPLTGRLKDGYPAIFSAMEQVDPMLHGLSAEINQVPPPTERDTTGEYFEVVISGLGITAQTIIHATENSGDIVGQPPRFSFLPDYIQVIDELLEKSGYEKRLYTAQCYRQISKEDILPVYVSLINPANSDPLLLSHPTLYLRGNERY